MLSRSSHVSKPLEPSDLGVISVADKAAAGKSKINVGTVGPSRRGVRAITDKGQ
jgi:hypothetical protein